MHVLVDTYMYIATARLGAQRHSDTIHDRKSGGGKERGTRTEGGRSSGRRRRLCSCAQLAPEPPHVRVAAQHEPRRVHEGDGGEHEEEQRVRRVPAPVSRRVRPREELLLQEAERERNHAGHEEHGADQAPSVRTREAQDSRSIHDFASCGTGAIMTETGHT